MVRVQISFLSRNLLLHEVPAVLVRDLRYCKAARRDSAENHQGTRRGARSERGESKSGCMKNNGDFPACNRNGTHSKKGSGVGLDFAIHYVQKGTSGLRVLLAEYLHLLPQ